MNNNILLLILGLLGLGGLGFVFKVLERKLATKAKSLEDDYESKLALVNASISENSERLGLKLSECFDKISSDRQFIERKIDEEISKLNISDLLVSVRQLEGKADELAEAYQASLDHILGFKGLLEEQGRVLNSKVEKNLKAVLASLDKQEAFSKNILKVSGENLDGKISGLKEVLNAEKANLVKYVDESREEFVGQFSQFEKLFEDRLASFEETMNTSGTKLNGQITEIEKSIKTLKAATDKSIKQNLEVISQGLSETNKAISDSSKKSNDMLEELRNGEEEVRSEIGNVNDKLVELIELSERVKADSMAQIQSIEAELESLGSLSREEKKAVQVIKKNFEQANKKMGVIIDTQKAAFDKAQKDLISELQSREESINGSLIGVKRNESLIKKTNEGLKDLESKITFSTGILEENKTRLEVLADEYKKELQFEKARISKALALGRASFSGFQMFFKGKHREDLISDAPTKRKLKKYDESVNKFGFLNGQIYQRFDRNLDREKIKGLIEKWQDILDVKISGEKLAYMAHKIWVIEGACSGRLATNVEDEIIRCLIAAYVGQEGLRGMEIGTLFGINICCMKELASPFCKSFKLTVVDPLEGYYSKQPNDILVDEPINEEIFWKNIGRFCNKREVNLIKKFTYDMDASSFGRRTFNYVLIDGDHTYDGVKVDFELIRDLVEPGGYILFDDYNTEHWPDVKTYVDEAVLTDDNYMEVISMHRTCVVQKIK